MNKLTVALVSALALLLTPSLYALNFPPAAVASASSSEIVLGESVQFDASGSTDPNGDPLTYLWNFGDETTSTAVSPTHEYPEAGQYAVSLRVSDGQANRFTGLTVTVLDPVSPLPPTRSRTMAIAQNSSQLWVVNPDSNTVGVLDISTNTPTLLQEIVVGTKPRTIALSPDESTAYVTCEGEHALYVINTATRTVSQAYPTGHMPYGVAVAPNDGRIVISNPGDGSLTVYSADFSNSTMIFTGEMPRAIAITGDGAYAYVTDYLTEGDTGTVWKINLTTGTIAKTIALIEDTGPDTTSSGIGFPNVLSVIEIEPSGRHLWVGGLKSNTSRGTLLSGEPLVPTNRIRGVLLEIDLTADEEVFEHRIDTNDADMASGIAYTPNGRYLLALHQGAEMMSVYDLPFARTITDKSSGDAVPFTRSDVGFAPQGIIVSADGTRAYVNNFLSRNVTVHDISDVHNPVTLATTATTSSELLTSDILNGKRLFYRSKAPLMSDSNYISCVSCHPDGGMADGRTWDFTQIGEGLRNTIDLRGKGGMDHGPVHWSANFNEIQDFENDIVNAFGGDGLAQDGMGPHHPLTGPNNGGRSQDLDDLAAYVASLKTPPPSPHRDENKLLTAEALVGRNLFFSNELKCATCHTSPRYTDSTLTPDPADFIFHNVGTLLPSSGQRLSGNLTGLDTPSLQGAWATKPYLHDGRAATLREVITTYNPSDLHGVTSQLSDTDLDALVAFMESIDGSPNDQWPVIDAGTAISASAGWLVDLAAVVTDDGLPATPGELMLRWESNATDFTVERDNASNTTVVFRQPGNYTLTLSASDDGGTTWPSSQVLNVTVDSSNVPPTQTYVQFKQAHFTPNEQLDDAISGIGANPDGDRNTNLVEYYQSSDPTANNVGNALNTYITNRSEGIWIRQHLVAEAIDVSTQWFRSTDLEHWAPATPSIYGYVTHENGIYTLEARFDRNMSDSVFYMLEISDDANN